MSKLKTKEELEKEFMKKLCSKRYGYRDGEETYEGMGVDNAEEVLQWINENYVPKSESYLHAMELMRNGLLLRAKIEGKDFISVKLLENLDIKKLIE